MTGRRVAVAVLVEVSAGHEVDERSFRLHDDAGAVLVPFRLEVHNDPAAVFADFPSAGPCLACCTLADEDGYCTAEGCERQGKTRARMLAAIDGACLVVDTVDGGYRLTGYHTRGGVSVIGEWSEIDHVADVVHGFIRAHGPATVHAGPTHEDDRRWGRA